MPLVEYTVKILVRQEEAPNLETAAFGDIGEVSVYRGAEYMQYETTNIEIIEEEEDE